MHARSDSALVHFTMLQPMFFFFSNGDIVATCRMKSRYLNIRLACMRDVKKIPPY